jgi:hypothetical protein
MFVLQEAISPKCHSDRETLTKHANRAEFHCSRKLVAAALAGAFGLRAHSPRRSAAATSTDSNTPPHRVVRNRPAWPLANCCPAAQAIACSFIVARQIRFRNKIPPARVLRRQRLSRAAKPLGLVRRHAVGESLCQISSKKFGQLIRKMTHSRPLLLSEIVS